MHCRAEEGICRTQARHLAEQKQDIQLLKQYRCATFQNWRKREYKILEGPAGAIRLDAVLRAVSKHSLVESGCLASPLSTLWLKRPTNAAGPQGLAALAIRR